jgi:hypothetical protein
VDHTYGYITKSNRIALNLEKSHSTDAFVIAGGTMQERSSVSFLIKQVRKCNRKLFKGDRSQIKNTAARIIHGFQRFDKLETANTFLIANMRRGTLIHTLKSVVSATPAPHGVL